MQQSSYVGIDVFKHHLDVAFLGGPKVWRAPDDANGIAALVRQYVGSVAPTSFVRRPAVIPGA